MQYEIRGILEEHKEDIAKGSAISVTQNRYLTQLPQKAVIDIAIESAYNKMVGFYMMWCIFKDEGLADDYEGEIWDLTNENSELIAYTVNEQLEKLKQQQQKEEEQEIEQRYDI
jgi:hypothetical protein